MFKSKKEKVEVPKEPMKVPQAFKNRYNEEEQEEIAQAVEGQEDFEESTQTEEQIHSIQKKIDQLKSKPIQRQTQVQESEWEITQVPARTVIRNKQTGEEIESWEDILRLLNGE